MSEETAWGKPLPDETVPELSSFLLRKRSVAAYQGESPTPFACMIDELSRNKAQWTAKSPQEEFYSLSSTVAVLATPRASYGFGISEDLPSGCCCCVAIPNQEKGIIWCK